MPLHALLLAAWVTCVFPTESHKLPAFLKLIDRACWCADMPLAATLAHTCAFCLVFLSAALDSCAAAAAASTTAMQSSCCASATVSNSVSTLQLAGAESVAI
jgi:hypothetical protein